MRIQKKSQKILTTILSIACLIIIWPVENAFPKSKNNTASISIDTSMSLGDMPGLYRAGLMGNWWDNFDPPKPNIVKLNAKPVWRLHFGFGLDCPGCDNEVKPPDFETDFAEWLNKIVDPRIKEYQESGYQIVISLEQVPKWLSMYPSDETMPFAKGDWFFKWAYSPPKDYSEWENLIKLFLLNQKKDGIDADYIIWDEPDWMFYGTEEQYLELYSHTVKALKEVDPDIQVGAPGTSQWSSGKTSNCPAEETGLIDGECPLNDHTMIKAIIDYSSENHLPLNFIDWHFPDKDSVAAEVETTRQWLKEAGLPESTPLTIGEWVFSSDSEEEFTEKASAYTVHLLKALMDNGIYRHTAASIYDQTGWQNSNWSHVGFFSSEGVIRTKWNSFRAVDKLSGQRIKAEITKNSNNISLLSSMNNGKLGTILSYYLSQEELALQAGISSLFSKSNKFVQKCIKKSKDEQLLFYDILTEYFLEHITIDEVGIFSEDNCGSFPDYLMNDLIQAKLTAYQVYTNELAYQPEQRKVEIKITNLAPGTYTYRKYIIDGNTDEIHANPCRYNKKTELSVSDTTCGINGAIDQAVYNAGNEAMSVASDYLLSLGYSQECIDALVFCFEDGSCDTIPLSCSQYQYDELKNDLNAALELYRNLFLHGTGKTPDNTTYSTSTYIDQINNIKEVSLEGSKEEKQVKIKKGKYKEKFIMQPYSVILIELSP